MTEPGEGSVRPLAISGDALRQLEEQLLLRYEYLPERELLVLVCDHWTQPLAGEGRTFLRLRFEGVRGFAREPGAHAALQAFTTSYAAFRARGAVVIEGIERGGEKGAVRRLTFWFGPAFGGVSFRYSVVQAHTRTATVERVGGTWVYRDAETGALLRFDEPFGD